MPTFFLSMFMYCINMYVYGAYVYTPENGRCFRAEFIWVVRDQKETMQQLYTDD